MLHEHSDIIIYELIQVWVDSSNKYLYIWELALPGWGPEMQINEEAGSRSRHMIFQKAYPAKTDKQWFLEMLQN